MHVAARRFVEQCVSASGPFTSVLEIGSRNVNGGVRDLFEGSVYEGVDKAPGDGVDYVCDAALTLPAGPYDCVVCCEVFEHEERWPTIVANAARVLMPDGALIVTAAGPGRAPHSAVDGGQLRDGEFYANVQPDTLTCAAIGAGLSDVTTEVNAAAGDVYMVAFRR